MAVSETRLVVLLKDGASAGLQSLNNSYNKFANTVQNSGNQLAQFNRQMKSVNVGGFASNADRAANSLSNMNKMMERLVYSASRYFVIYKAMGAVGNVWDALVGGSYEYAKSLETNQIGIAGILKSMITLNGEAVKWNDAMAISGQAMKSLQSEALRTAATSKELIETFRALLGPGLASGMNIDQIVKLSTVGTNAVRSLGLPTNQYVQELRSIITEGIRPASSTLATSLGITNKDIKEAKASAEGLYNFLMKRIEGFADAVKYTSGTVEGRIARIQEGLQVAGAKGAQELYNSFSNVLEKIANYLIPVPEKLEDKWEINPQFINSVKEVSETVGKIVENIGKVGELLAPLVGGALSTGLTVLGQVADKLKIITGYFVAKKLSPYIADMAKLAIYSRDAYQAETGLGRALQGVSDKLHGRIADLQRLIAEQNIYNASIDAFFDVLGRMNTINSMVNNNANSITNLAAKWQRMGMNAKQAGEIQHTVLGLTLSAYTETAQAMIRHGDALAKEIEETKRYEAAVKNAFNTELSGLNKIINAKYKKTESDKINAFISSKGVTEEQFENTQLLISKLQQLELEEDQVYKLALKYTQEIKRGGIEAAKATEQQILAAARNFIQTKENLAIKQQEIILNSKTVLEQSALANAYRQGGEGAYQALTRIIEREENLIVEMRKRGLATEEVERRHLELLNAIATATNSETGALIKNTEQIIANNEAQIGLNANKQKGIQQATTMISAIGSLGMSFGILCDVLAQADEANKEWYESAGEAVMTAGMFATAISSIISIMPDVIRSLRDGAKALMAFAKARTLAGLGLAGGVVAGIGAVVYNAYQNYKETGIASQYDEEGNLVSHDFGKMRDIDDADSYAILNNPSYSYDAGSIAEAAIGLKEPKVGGGGSKGGSSKANKAEQFAERLKKIIAELNKETQNMNDNATAYEKTMASAQQKVAKYDEDILKAEQYGLDVSKARTAQEELLAAAKKKAVQAQEDENLKYMKLSEDQANRIYTMGGTMNEQRRVLSEHLEAHKAYLEELLSAEIENKERRYQLEAELANVVKQINDNNVYEFKEGWKQALDELANRQINFKDAFVSAFDSIEGSLVTLVSSTESAKDKFKKFCEDVTNTILKSMTQIIIKGLITKAIMAAIGLGGGSVSAGDTSAISSTASNWTGKSLIESGGISVGLAGGGTVQKGGTYVVGENGPELLQMGNSGKIYNNRETKSMLNGGIENVKVEIVNKSGQEVKASDANVKFDGKTLIVSTVIDAVATNYMGVRSVLKGAATT